MSALESFGARPDRQVARIFFIAADGPFAETKEQLGGYYLVEAKDLDEATKLAARIPGAKTGSIEVRPIMVLPTGYPRP